MPPILPASFTHGYTRLFQGELFNIRVTVFPERVEIWGVIPPQVIVQGTGSSLERKRVC